MPLFQRPKGAVKCHACNGERLSFEGNGMRQLTFNAILFWLDNALRPERHLPWRARMATVNEMQLESLGCCAFAAKSYSIMTYCAAIVICVGVKIVSFRATALDDLTFRYLGSVIFHTSIGPHGCSKKSSLESVSLIKLGWEF